MERWKNNIERQAKFSSLEKDAFYIGNDAVAKARSRYCGNAIALSLNIKSHFDRLTILQRQRLDKITLYGLPHPMPSHMKGFRVVTTLVPLGSDRAELDSEICVRRYEPTTPVVSLKRTFLELDDDYEDSLSVEGFTTPPKIRRQSRKMTCAVNRTLQEYSNLNGPDDETFYTAFSPIIPTKMRLTDCVGSALNDSTVKQEGRSSRTQVARPLMIVPDSSQFSHEDVNHKHENSLSTENSFILDLKPKTLMFDEEADHLIAWYLWDGLHASGDCNTSQSHILESVDDSSSVIDFANDTTLTDFDHQTLKSDINSFQNATSFDWRIGEYFSVDDENNSSCVSSGNKTINYSCDNCSQYCNECKASTSFANTSYGQFGAITGQSIVETEKQRESPLALGVYSRAINIRDISSDSTSSQSLGQCSETVSPDEPLGCDSFETLSDFCQD